MKNSTPLLFILLIFLSFPGKSFCQLPGQVALNPKSIPQFVDPLPHFAGARVDAKAGGDLYVKAVPAQQVALSTGTVLATGIVGNTPDIGLANLWVYQISADGGSTYTPPLWPAFTIEAQRGNPLNVYYSNELSGETYSNVGLIVDHTLHWADPNGDMGPYDGEPPITVHLHGGEVPPTSDGGPDSWYTPTGVTGHAWNPDPYYYYPNSQEAATLWFHDHALGVTRLNVYAGMAGFYFLRGTDEESKMLPGWSGDDMVQEVASPGKSGTFNPNPYLPEIEIAIQDRMFDNTGKLFFPNLPTNPLMHPTWTPEFVGDIITVNGKTWPYLSVAPRKYRFRILNGSNARTYELWLQDLATGTFGPAINQIGTDGGLLNAPVIIDPAVGGKLVLMPGERADVVVDFSVKPGAVWTMRNSGKTPYPAGATPKATTLGRIMQFVVNGTMVDANANGLAQDESSLPASLRSPNLVQLTNFSGAPAAGVKVAKTRQLTLNEVMGMGGPLEVLVNNTMWSGTHKMPDGTIMVREDFADVTNSDGSHTYYSEVIDEGTTEVWKIINLTADAHPIHLHLVQFQLMSRQKFNFNNYNNVYNASFPGMAYIGGYGPPKTYDFYYNSTNNTGWLGGNPDVTPYLQGPVRPAKPNEKGWKDTFVMFPGEVTTVIARFAPTDKAADLDPTKDYNEMWFPFDPNGGHGYVWHCHIIDHEDNEMMRPFMVMPNPARGKGVSAPGNIVLPGNTSSQNASALASGDIEEIILEQNYPNPFADETMIKFVLPAGMKVKLDVLSLAGLKIKTLLDADAPAGLNTVKLNAGGLASGIYFYQLTVGEKTLTRRMVVQK